MRWFPSLVPGILGLFFILAGLLSAAVPFFVLALILWAGSSLMLRRYCAVELDGDALLISKSPKQVRVPLAQIIEVTGGYWGQLLTISIVFDRDIGLGTRISFLPPRKFGRLSQEHPFVAELRGLAGLPQ